MQAANHVYEVSERWKPSFLKPNKIFSPVLQENDRRYSILLPQVSQALIAGTSTILFCNIQLPLEISDIQSQFCILVSSGPKSLWKGVIRQFLELDDLHLTQGASIGFQCFSTSSREDRIVDNLGMSLRAGSQIPPVVGPLLLEKPDFPTSLQIFPEVPMGSLLILSQCSKFEEFSTFIALRMKLNCKSHESQISVSSYRYEGLLFSVSKWRWYQIIRRDQELMVRIE